MKSALRLALLLLGFAMGWSALQHWTPSEQLIQHYREVGLGERGRVAVAVMQSVAALSLLVPRLQASAAFILAIVMLLISARNACIGEVAQAVQPLAIAAWALLPAYGLRRTRAVDAGAK